MQHTVKNTLFFVIVLNITEHNHINAEGIAYDVPKIEYSVLHVVYH